MGCPEYRSGMPCSSSTVIAHETIQLEKMIKNRLANLGHKRSFRGPRRAPRDQIWSQLLPMGPPGLDSWSPLTLTWYWVPSGPPGALEGPILTQMSQISMALFLWDIFCVPNIALWGVQSITTERPAHPALLQPIWNHPACIVLIRAPACYRVVHLVIFICVV